MKQLTYFEKLPYRLHQFRFFYSEQSRVRIADMYGVSISVPYGNEKSILLESEVIIQNQDMTNKPHF